MYMIEVVCGNSGNLTFLCILSIDDMNNVVKLSGRTIF